MSIVLDNSYGTGEGTDGALTLQHQTMIVNNYAQVTAYSGMVATLGNISTGGVVGFDTVGAHVLIHISGYRGSDEIFNGRGNWKTAKIVSYNASTKQLTLSRSLKPFLNSFNFSDLAVQIITIPCFSTVTLNIGGVITCPQFNPSLGYGGIVAFKCSKELKFNKGHVILAKKGMLDDSLWAHGAIKKEQVDFGSTGQVLRESAGWENYRTRQHLTINYPDGACWIIAEKMTCHSSSRIGNNDGEGVARSRGGTTTLWGGSSIFLVAKTIENWMPSIIAKYCSSPSLGTSTSMVGKGISRCYIASETSLPMDEALYAYDKISDPERLARLCNIRDFGNGGRGNQTNYNKQLSSYLSVKKLRTDRKTYEISEGSEGVGKFAGGALVMVHLTSRGKVFNQTGRFFLAKFVGKTDSTITLDTALPEEFDRESLLDDYHVQLITVPQFKNFTLDSTQIHNKTPEFRVVTGSNKCAFGGIFAIAVSEVLDLSDGGKIIVESGGGAPAYGEAGLEFVGNSQMCDRLPIGAGHGSVFILANELKLSATSRIGASYTGNSLGGINYDKNKANAQNATYQYFGSQSLDADNKSAGTYGGCDGAGVTGGGQNGGYGSNAVGGACQGAHIFIVANKITGFNLAAISTGGSGSSTPSPNGARTSNHGGASYGGSGGSNAKGTASNLRGGNGGFIGGGGGCDIGNIGGGGSGAFCFIYCNDVVNQSTDGISYD